MSHQVLDIAKRMLAKEVVMRANRAKPRRVGVKEESNGVSALNPVLLTNPILVSFLSARFCQSPDFRLSFPVVRN